jgi:hypothetical protein
MLNILGTRGAAPGIKTLTIPINDRRDSTPVNIGRREHRHQRGTLKAKLLSDVSL